VKTIVIIISFLCISIQSLELNTIRNGYREASQDSTKLEAYNMQLTTITKSSKTVFVGYKGAGIALKGRYSKKIKEKKRFFIEGVSLVEYAIEKSPRNIELRFIRLGIQENTPKLLKYKGKIEEDKKYILNNFKTVKSSRLKKHIEEYILQSKVFTTEEKKVFLNL